MRGRWEKGSSVSNVQGFSGGGKGGKVWVKKGHNAGEGGGLVLIASFCKLSGKIGKRITL